MTKITYAKALIDGLHGCMSEDDRVSLMGSYVLGLSPLNTLVDRLRDDFADRIADPPISEAAVAATGIGAAMAGDRPFVDIGTASFIFEAWSQVVNEAANAHYMSGGQVTVPVVFHMLHGLRGGGGAQHSHSPQAMLFNCPGLEIVLPASPADVKGLIRQAIRSDNPTIVVDHAKLLAIEEEVPDDNYEIPFGQANVRRLGGDATIVATSLSVQTSLEAAEILSQQGVEVEVIDPRTIVPLDMETILTSVEKTGRLVVVDEANLRCSIASEIGISVAEQAFSSLKAAIIRVARPDVPVPFSPPLENYISIDVDKIVKAVEKVTT
ncbi:MAG: transketolase C-terminal domain-containing protein [Rhodospirillales bacterium]|jgi:pyruvate dehydrogenase E1 component beta subunit|nr:transketolase C-terminal domain-containing protein [Rhodospirillales bacterium]|tara:strand:+ start:131 stop:1102 length:972 start_codon:yes stop_codon:yes gene_type:complete